MDNQSHHDPTPDTSTLLSEAETSTSIEHSSSDGENEAAFSLDDYREVLASMPPGYPFRWLFLNNLANALLTQYEQNGERSELLEAIELHGEALNVFPPGHPIRSNSLNNLANGILTRYQQDGNRSDPVQVIELYREALTIYPPGLPKRSTFLNNLASAVRELYQQEGKTSDLAEAIELDREALTLCPPGHPDRSMCLNNLAIDIHARYARDGKQSDLVEAIELHREALSLFPPGHPNRSTSLSNLAEGILIRYQQDGERSDLLEGIELNREALILRPPGNPGRSSSLNNLANAILSRYEEDGERSDLVEAIELHREALTLRPPGHPKRSISLNSLANAIFTRYTQNDVRSDLLEVIKLCREALKLVSPGRPNRSMFLSNLANAVFRKYEEYGGRSGLLEVIELRQEALHLVPPGHPNRPVFLSHLADAIYKRYEQEGERLDLLEVIKFHKEAIALLPLGHPNRWRCLGSLALVFYLESFRAQALPNLTEARRYLEEALESMTKNHPHWSETASTLAWYLFDISQLSDNSLDGELPPVDEIIQLLRNAVAAKTSLIPHRLRAALRWTRVATTVDSTSISEAYQAAFTHLGSALALGRSLQDRHSGLLSDDLRRGLALEAAIWALAGISPNLELAVELLDQGRNVLLASVGQFRADLSHVRRKDPGLGEEFYRIGTVLQSAILTGQEISEAKSFHEDPASRYERVSADWEAVVSKIRLLSGCEDFLLPTPYIKLQEAAQGSPVIVVIAGKGQSIAIIVTVNDEPHVVDLPNASEEALKTLYEELEDAVGTLSDDRRAIRKLPQVLSKLWEIVVGPVIEDLRDVLQVALGSRIWWYPTSWASFLPLHAAGSYTTGGLNVPDLYISSYTPTLQALLRARGHSASSSDATQGPLVVAQAQTPGQVDIVHVDDEAKIIRRLAPDASVLSGDQGTKESVLKELRKHSWVHLACHGHPDTRDPFQSHFALHDGPLSLQDIITNDHPCAEFAFLSACHSAAPDRTLPDEGLTLAGGMQFAGFKSVIGTLWEMADEDAPTLARVFYNGVVKRSKDRENLDCTKTAEALHEAVQRLREKRVPLFRWVNLVHYGI